MPDNLQYAPPVPRTQVALQLLQDVRLWLEDSSEPFHSRFGYVPAARRVGYHYQLSPTSRLLKRPETGHIVLVQQFYVSSDLKRHGENQACLRFNCGNDAISRIVLLNERHYDDAELGLVGVTDLKKVKQIVIGKRLTFGMVFDYAASGAPPGAFIALANTDIFFDRTLLNARRVSLKGEKKVLCQLRHEYDGSQSLRTCLPSGAPGVNKGPSDHVLYADSQDAWLWNARWRLPDALRPLFDVPLGVPGCDNKIIYLLSLAGFTCHSEPLLVKSYHYHASQLRGYGNLTPVPPPYIALLPSVAPPGCRLRSSFDFVRENDVLREFVAGARERGECFLLPRLGGIENDIAALGAELRQCGALPSDRQSALAKLLPQLKVHAGIHLSTNREVVLYADEYLQAFREADRYFWFPPWSSVYAHYALSHEFMLSNFTQGRIDSRALDIFNNVWSLPWTRALRGARLLIVSAFSKTLEKQAKLVDKVYGVDLFPDCTFTFLTPPQTQGQSTSAPYEREALKLRQEVRRRQDEFDVALCSCGGYGAPLSRYIRTLGKSAIYVGGALQMYFGVIGARWERETPDVLEAYANEHWVRPSTQERPEGHTSIESGCYW